MSLSKATYNGGCAWSAGCRVYAFNAWGPFVVGTLLLIDSCSRARLVLGDNIGLRVSRTEPTCHDPVLDWYANSDRHN